MICRPVIFRWLLLLGVLAVVACDRDKDSAPDKASVAPIPVNPISADAAGPALTLPPDSGPPPAFDGERAMQYLKDIVKFGPRPVGSANHKKVEEYIASHLKGDQVEDDNFTADTPEGKVPVHNIIAKYPGTKDGIIVIASHYDTNYPLRNTSYVGRERWRVFQRAAVGTRQPVARQAPRRLQRLAGMGRRRRGDEARWFWRLAEGNAVR